MVMTEFDDVTKIRPKKGGCVKVVLCLPSSVNVVLLRYEAVLERILTVRFESCLESFVNLRVK